MWPWEKWTFGHMGFGMPLPVLRCLCGLLRGLLSLFGLFRVLIFGRLLVGLRHVRRRRLG